MGGKRRAQPSGNPEDNAASNGDTEASQEGGASRKRQTLQLSVDGAAADSADARSCGQEESDSTKSPVTLSLSLRWDTTAMGRAALEAALRKAVTDLGGREFGLEWTRVGPSEDTLQRVLPLVLEGQEPQFVLLCFQACKPWRRELEARGFCSRTLQLCVLLAEGRRDVERFGQNALQKKQVGRLF